MGQIKPFFFVVLRGKKLKDLCSDLSNKFSAETNGLMLLSWDVPQPSQWREHETIKTIWSSFLLSNEMKAERRKKKAETLELHSDMSK